MTATVDHTKWKKLLLQMVLGGVLGAAATGGLLMLFSSGGMDVTDPNRLAALVAGMVYALMGLVVGLGLAAPNAGAKLLNVEDAEELREERPNLWMATLGCILIGLFLLTLAAAGDGARLLSDDQALVLAGTSFVGLIAMNLWLKRRYDEFTRQVSVEASALAMHCALVLVGGWAALAHLGQLPWISPLGMVALLALLELGAILWVATRKGMMTPRG